MTISVCMCTYNGGKYIEEQLNSIVNQTQLPNEIVIFDDNSTDNTLELIYRIKNLNTNVNWIIKKNDQNIGWKQNFCDALSFTSGDYVFLCDQDDIWDLNKIEEMIFTMNSHNNIDLLATNMIIKNENTGHLKKMNETYKCYPIVNNKNILFTSRPGCTYCIRRIILTDFFKLFNNQFSHDALLWKIAFLKNRLYLLEYNGIIWRRHFNSASTNRFSIFSSENCDEHYQVLLDYILYINRLENLEGLSKEKLKLIGKTKKMLLYRKKLYETKRIIYLIKLFKYINLYPTIKSFLFDFCAVTKFNKRKI